MYLQILDNHLLADKTCPALAGFKRFAIVANLKHIKSRIHVPE